MGGVPAKIGAAAIGWVLAMLFAVKGIEAVKTRAIRGRWGQVTTGPLAVAMGMFMAVAGGIFGGWALYALLITLIHGR
jgi:hypothetical protein